MMRSIARGLATAALVLLAALPLSRLAAQSDPRLAAAIRLAQEGQGDSARAAVQKVLAATPPGDTLYPQALLAAATTATTAADRQRYLQRIVIEYPSSEWSDDALLGLVQLDYAGANLPNAARNLERLRLDYPGTPLLPTASLWAARVYFDAREPASACRWLQAGLQQVGTDVEQRNQLEYYSQRCANVSLADTAAAKPTATDSARPGSTASSDTLRRTEPARAPAPTPPPPAASPAPATKFAVQITAARNQAAAEAAAQKLRALGIQPHIVQEQGYFKVRGGPFASRAEAAEALIKIKARLGGTPFIVSE